MKSLYTILATIVIVIIGGCVLQNEDLVGGSVKLNMAIKTQHSLAIASVDFTAMELLEETEIEEEVRDPEIEELVEERQYTSQELDIMSRLIYGEASGCSWELQVAVGSVVLNRVNDDRYPDTIEAVVFQKGQYACTWDGNYNKVPDEQAVEAAIYLLENGSQIPDYVIFQAEFTQGEGTWQKIENEYFCY